MASSAPDHLRTPGLISNRPCYEGINLGQRHDHEIRIEVLHEIQVLNIEAYVTEATDFR